MGMSQGKFACFKHFLQLISMSKSNTGTEDRIKNVTFESRGTVGSGGGAGLASDASERPAQPPPPRRGGNGLGMVMHSPPVQRSSSNPFESGTGTFEIPPNLLRNFAAPAMRQSAQSFLTGSTSSSSSSSSSSSPPHSSDKRKRAHSAEAHRNKEGDGDEDSDAETDRILAEPFNPQQGLQVVEEGAHAFMGFVNKSVLNRDSLCFSVLFSAFGTFEKFDPVFHKIEPGHMTAILARLRTVPKDWAHGKVAKTTYSNAVENLAYRTQLSLRSVQDEMLGMLHAVEQGDSHLLIQLIVDTYALATQASTDCHEARIASGVPSLSRAMQSSNRTALVTPGVEARLEELGVEDSLTTSFFPTGGRGYRSTPFLRSRGQGYGRGRGGWGRGYGWGRGNYFQPQPWWGYQQQQQPHQQQQNYQQNYQPPYTSRWRGGRGRSFTPPPGRGGWGRGKD
jgi:hypothetical protein